MSVRMRSTIGAVLGAVGVLLGLGGLLFLRPWMFWGGAVLAVAAVALVVWAVRDVGREIGTSSARFEAMLRSEIPPKREQKPGGDR